MNDFYVVILCGSSPVWADQSSWASFLQTLENWQAAFGLQKNTKSRGLKKPGNIIASVLTSIEDGACKRFVSQEELRFTGRIPQNHTFRAHSFLPPQRDPYVIVGLPMILADEHHQAADHER